ncbi:hypothetical protein COCOBI_01-6320 [Coccomyxa sp. Obi]|nr:hypothetical protein COCOBI_01-6320 [Coccomyxa sp. Obi]
MILLLICLTATLSAIPSEASNTQIYVDGCLPGTKQASSLHCLSQENIKLREEAKLLRKQLGAISCRCDDLGPSGGFCLDVEHPSKGGNDYMDNDLVKELHSLYDGHSVLDLGCGLGQYGEALRLLGIDWTGYDGAEHVEEATKGLVQFMDLSKPHWLGKQYDWVMSLEVGEHLPSEVTSTFVGNLLRHAKCGLVLSWALPGQGGHHHVNELSNADVISMIEEGSELRFDRGKTAMLRAHASVAWFKNTLMVFDGHGKNCMHHGLNVAPI